MNTISYGFGSNSTIGGTNNMNSKILNSPNKSPTVSKINWKSPTIGFKSGTNTEMGNIRLKDNLKQNKSIHTELMKKFQDIDSTGNSKINIIDGQNLNSTFNSIGSIPPLKKKSRKYDVNCKSTLQYLPALFKKSPK